MKARLLSLAQRIRAELTDLERIVRRAQEGWARAERSSDDYYLDGVALNLHGFYAGLERLFALVNSQIDRISPEGANWHQVLLQQMAVERPGVRPAVISPTTREALEEFRGFRHVVRNVYTFQFDPARVRHLVDRVPALLDQLRRELLAFADFLDQRAAGLDSQNTSA